MFGNKKEKEEELKVKVEKALIMEMWEKEQKKGRS